jgi:glutamine cyclotransferase
VRAWTRTWPRAFGAVAFAFALVVLVSCGSSSADPQDAAPLGPVDGSTADYTVRVLQTYEHDDKAFTQGLVWAGDDQLFESTGRRGSSSLRRMEVVSGDVVQRHDLDDEYFAEGLAQVGDRLIQLTWQEHVAFVYDAESFEQIGTFEYEGEGWGLCYDGSRLVMSDGTATLTFRDEETFEPISETVVRRSGQPLAALNELECVGGRVYANVFGSDRIVEIDPESGTVTAEIDASSLTPPAAGDDGEVLNGIAYDPSDEIFYLTGKNWPTLYAVTFEKT